MAPDAFAAAVAAQIERLDREADGREGGPGLVVAAAVLGVPVDEHDHVVRLCGLPGAPEQAQAVLRLVVGFDPAKRAPAHPKTP